MVTRVLRCNEESRTYHKLKATRTFPPHRRPMPNKNSASRDGDFESQAEKTTNQGKDELRTDKHETAREQFR